jgi:hypothetical protein
MRERDGHLELTVKLDPAREPITGDIVASGGQARAFSGWLELMELLDAARHDTRQRPADTGGNE